MTHSSPTLKTVEHREVFRGFESHSLRQRAPSDGVLWRMLEAEGLRRGHRAPRTTLSIGIHSGAGTVSNYVPLFSIKHVRESSELERPAPRGAPGLACIKYAFTQTKTSWSNLQQFVFLYEIYALFQAVVGKRHQLNGAVAR